MLILFFWRENSYVPSSWKKKWKSFTSKRLYSKKKNLSCCFFLEYVENAEFIAEKIWKLEGLSKILTTATETYDRPWYPEKTTHVDLHFWFLLRSFYCAKFWKTLKNNFLSKCGSRFSLKNAEFIARKIWTSKGLSKILTMGTWSCERPWYPEKTTELNPYSIAWILLVQLELFSVLAKKSCWETILVENLWAFKSRFFISYSFIISKCSFSSFIF